ncbi:hypothetical protein FRC10_008673 [Ceratobasidium sp. 414]|nr:hypothetical protein FRC10_008673 [Ceratobasidium sp. 414]
MSLDGAPVAPPEFQIYNSYVIDPQYARYFTIAWTSTLAAFAVVNAPSLIRAVRRRRLPSPRGLWEGAYGYQPIQLVEDKRRTERPDSDRPPVPSQSPLARTLALGSSLVQTVSLRSLSRTRVDLGQCFMALSLLTPTFLFASKNSPAALLLGKGYEKLNWVHRWAGRLLFLMATTHGSLWMNNRIRNGQGKLLRTGTKEREGMAAYGTLCMIVLLSLRPVRAYAYQFFYMSHILGYMTFFIMICYHTPYAEPWIFPPIAFWGLDLVVRLARFRLKDAYLTSIDQQMTLIRIPDVQGGWMAGQHVRLRVFFGGRPFESHPLTILNADLATTALPQSSPTSIGITLGARAVGDWSCALNRLASETGSGGDVRVSVMLDGPYGGLSLDLGDFESVLLVAGGSGATFTLGVLDDIVGRIVRHHRAKGEKTRYIKYVWFIKSYACDGTSLSLSFHFYVTCLCDPGNLSTIRNSKTEEAKPMIEDLLAPMLEGSQDAEKGSMGFTTGGIAVAASGPESLVCQARNAVARVGPSAAMRVGGVQVHTELFAL